MTIAQAIKLAAALHQKAQTGAVTLKNGSPWYSTYVSYAVANGIIEPEYASYKPALMNSPISRAEFVHIFYDAMPSGSYAARNTVQDNAIPDVSSSDLYADEIYTFYRTGILTGSNSNGDFNSNSSIQRSEVAAILIRMFDASARRNITLTKNTTTTISGAQGPAGRLARKAPLARLALRAPKARKARRATRVTRATRATAPMSATTAISGRAVCAPPTSLSTPRPRTIPKTPSVCSEMSISSPTASIFPRVRLR